MSERVEHVADRLELEQRVSKYVAERGYAVREDRPGEVRLKASGGGGIWWHLLLLLTTAGFGNLAYYAYKRATADSVRLVVESDPERAAEASLLDGGETAGTKTGRRESDGETA
jgi:hypothetical protein